MRRGLLAWSPDEVPPGVLDARVARCQAAMAEAGMDALVLYTSFPRPAAVSFLTHFVPYWNQGVLVVLADGAPTLFVSLSKRVGGWIEETAHIAEVICTPRLGATIGGFLKERLAAPKAIGVLELSRLPGGIASPLAGSIAPAVLTDASALFAAARHPADEAELAISAHAETMARDAFAALEPGGTSAPLISTLDGTLRRRGAEEVSISVAPDLDRDIRLVRPEADIVLGDRAAVQLSLAYKAHWIRVTHTLTRAGIDAEGHGAFRQALGRTPGAAGLPEALACAVPGAELRSWSAEVNRGSNPLTLAASATSPRSSLPGSSVVSVTASYDGPDGRFVFGAPFIVRSP